ncbi:hypothetical protein SD80_004250 [Scytonema tolypothrichoides VB-61278]|nr:hypothetical protein SD80_004250 [Scytonema tolypothrichoides VB-61278]
MGGALPVALLSRNTGGYGKKVFVSFVAGDTPLSAPAHKNPTNIRKKQFLSQESEMYQDFYIFMSSCNT